MNRQLVRHPYRIGLYRVGLWGSGALLGLAIGLPDFWLSQFTPPACAEAWVAQECY